MLYNIRNTLLRYQKLIALAPVMGLVFALYIFVPGIFIADAFADCSDVQDIHFNETMNKECPAFNPADPTTICAPDAQGPLTKHIINGDCDPPKNLRLGNMAFEGAGGITQGGRWGAQDVTQLGNCASSANMYNSNCAVTQGVNSPSVNAPAPTSAQNLNQPATAVSTLPSTLPTSTNPNCSPVQATSSVVQTSTPNQMALPILNQTIAFSSAVSVGNLVNLGNVQIGTPPIVPPGQGSVINNLLATGDCAGSVFPVPNNTVFLVAGAGSTQAASTYNFTQDSTATTQLVPNDAVDLNFTSFGVLNLPQGATFQDPTNSRISIPVGGAMASFGDGTNRIIAVNAAGDQIILPQAQWPAAQNGTIGLPTGTYGCNYDSDTNQLINCYVRGNAYTYTIPTNNVSSDVVKFIPINSASVANIIVTTSALSVPGGVPAAVPTTNISPTAGSYFNIPSGTPVGFAVNTPGSVTLPSGANFIDPSGNSVYLPQNTMLFAAGNGSVVPALILDNNQIQLSSGVSNGLIQFTGPITTIVNGQPGATGTVAFNYPPTTPLISLITSAVGIPAGTTIPINTTCSAINPQTSSSANATPLCPSI